MEPITRFHGEYEFLSNFYPIGVELDGILYPTVEHAFQAAKTFDPIERELIQQAASPGSAKRLGRKVTLRADWDEYKEEIMRTLLIQKFSHPDLRPLLLGTGNAELIEGNTWNDTRWGCVLRDGKWVGKNRLGNLLMEVRTKLQEEKL